MVAILALIPKSIWLLASAYGSGTYGSAIYNGTASSSSSSAGVQVGPITLPVTGAGLLTILGALAIAIGAGLFVWAHQRRKRGELGAPPR